MQRFQSALAILPALVLAGCTAVVTAPPAPVLHKPAVSATQRRNTTEAHRLRETLAHAVPQTGQCDPSSAAEWVPAAQHELAAAGVTLDRPQLIVAVDRNPRHQALCILLAEPDAAWQVIGGSKVSTGQTGRRGYFVTPTGVFRHTGSILDYRAEGTFNDNHIRGLGLKGMRVWDFGWQQAEKGWTGDRETAEIRLLLHATDPDYLERRLGRPASKGCVRVPAAMNRFLDHHGVLDAAYEQAAPNESRIAAVLAPDREPTPLAGDTLVVIDTEAPLSQD